MTSSSSPCTLNPNFLNPNLKRINLQPSHYPYDTPFLFLYSGLCFSSFSPWTLRNCFEFHALTVSSCSNLSFFSCEESSGSVLLLIPSLTPKFTFNCFIVLTVHDAFHWTYIFY
ncbi:hypothetical protein V6Z11_A06G020800 [Gossypium hirsutum]